MRSILRLGWQDWQDFGSIAMLLCLFFLADRLALSGENRA